MPRILLNVAARQSYTCLEGGYTAPAPPRSPRRVFTRGAPTTRLRRHDHLGAVGAGRGAGLPGRESPRPLLRESLPRSVAGREPRARLPEAPREAGGAAHARSATRTPRTRSLPARRK